MTAVRNSVKYFIGILAWPLEAGSAVAPVENWVTANQTLIVVPYFVLHETNHVILAEVRASTPQF